MLAIIAFCLDDKKMDAARVRYVFLDRDGVINRKMPEGAYVTQWSQFEWLPGAIEAIARLRSMGLKIFVVTNQRGVARQLYTIAELEQIHRTMQSELAQRGAPFDAIYYCPHDRGECRCRKPDVGLLERAFEEFPLANAANSLMIGDSYTDIEAGKRLGLQTIFIQDPADSQRPGAAAAAQAADAVAASLLEATEKHLLSGAGKA